MAIVGNRRAMGIAADKGRGSHDGSGIAGPTFAFALVVVSVWCRPAEAVERMPAVIRTASQVVPTSGSLKDEALRQKVLELAGPALTVEEVEASGPIFASYEANFRQFGNLHWARGGSRWDEVNYYDRAKIYYVWWARSGNIEYLVRANAIAMDYRVNYLEANDYSTSAHWAQTVGVALHYIVTGDEASRTAVGKIADGFAAPYYLDNLGNPNAEMDCRIQARTLEAFLYAYKIHAPSVGVPKVQADGQDWGVPGHNDWAALLHSSLNKILMSQAPDGAYRWDRQSEGNKPFMVGMLNDILIDYYDKFEADARITNAVKKSVDYMWARNWGTETRAFMYSEREPIPAPDLNNMISSGFGFVYRMSGDQTYKEKGDQIFAASVQKGWLNGSKQLNQAYTTSYKYLAYRRGGEHARNRI